jgi:hypothetical protein
VDDVRLPELATIQKYSIAVRAEYAPADEVIAALKTDLEALTRAGGRSSSTRGRSASAKKKSARGSSTRKRA